MRVVRFTDQSIGSDVAASPFFDVLLGIPVQGLRKLIRVDVENSFGAWTGVF
jgi:hypothetical protein